MKRKTIFSLLALAASAALFVVAASRKYSGIDTSVPKIEMEQDEITVSIYDDEAELLKGVTAQDAGDGDVTDSLVVESISEFVEGTTRIVNYAAFDRDNHVSKAFRRMTYSDYRPIHLSLDAPLRFPMTTTGNMDPLAEIQATDCLDGDISDKITFTTDSVVDASIAGDYPVTLTVTNSAGDVLELPVTVTIYDQSVENSAPKFELSDYLIYVDQGASVDPLDYIEYIMIRGTEYEVTDGRGTYGIDTDDMDSEERTAFLKRDPEISTDYLEIDNPVDTSEPGSYEITYKVEDEEHNTGTIRLIVIVEED